MPTNQLPRKLPQPGRGDVSVLVGSAITARLSSSAPQPERVAGQPGIGEMASRSDHTHPRLSSTFSGTLDANGRASVTFTRTFDKLPCVDALLIEAADKGSVVFKVESWLDDTGAAWVAGRPYGGCVLYGYRTISKLPKMTQVGVGALLTAVVTTLNLVIAGLSEMSLETPAVGAEFTGFAIASSKP